MKNLCGNLDAKAAIPVKLGKPSSVVLFPRRSRFPTRACHRKVSVSVSVEEAKLKVQCGGQGGWIESAAKSAFGFGVSASFFFSVFCHSPPALAESLTIAFPVSRAPEVNAVQRTLVEAWGLIRETFVDPTFNHQDWDLKLQQTMVEMFPLNSADAAYTKISGMLSTLGDPFTRIISPKEYQGFRIGSDGNLQGVGLFINVEPRTGHLVVLSCIEGSPAARAGIHQGDELVEINGERLDGIDSEGAAQRLRGNAGTIVTVKVKDSGKNFYIREVKLPREYIKLSPISKAIIPHRSPDGELTKTGYVKLSAFSQTAAEDMKNAIQEMENQGVHSYILDLRNNPGGLVKAGLDVAQMWLDGDETLVNTIDRNGNMLPINMIDGHAITHDPLVVITTLATKDTSCESSVTSGQHSLTTQNPPRDASPVGLLSIAEETLAEFLSKATGTAVEWVQMPGMKICERPLKNTQNGPCMPPVQHFVRAEMLPSGYLIRPCDGGGSIIHIVDHMDLEVNEGSASASEILAGALHDNGRAILVGHKTFGKGKIQSVTELRDGSALFVTVAKYLSPALHDIDQVGITPDVQCTTEMLNSPKDLSTKDKTSVSSLEADSCIMVAEQELDMEESKGTAS